MIVYHGTTEEIKKPDVKHSKKYLDFGEGFYLTTYEEQARRWAVRKAIEYYLLKKKMKNGWSLYVRVARESL